MHYGCCGYYYNFKAYYFTAKIQNTNTDKVLTFEDVKNILATDKETLKLFESTYYDLNDHCYKYKANNQHVSDDVKSVLSENPKFYLQAEIKLYEMYYNSVTTPSDYLKVEYYQSFYFHFPSTVIIATANKTLIICFNAICTVSILLGYAAAAALVKKQGKLKAFSEFSQKEVF